MTWWQIMILFALIAGVGMSLAMVVSLVHDDGVSWERFKRSVGEWWERHR